MFCFVRREQTQAEVNGRWENGRRFQQVRRVISAVGVSATQQCELVWPRGRDERSRNMRCCAPGRQNYQRVRSGSPPFYGAFDRQIALMALSGVPRPMGEVEAGLAGNRSETESTWSDLARAKDGTRSRRRDKSDLRLGFGTSCSRSARQISPQDIQGSSGCGVQPTG